MKGIIHLLRPQNFSKNKYFLPPDMHTHVSVSAGGRGGGGGGRGAGEGGRNITFSENFAYVLNDFLQLVYNVYDAT